MGRYSVVAQKDGYEIRQYEPYILAETPMRDDSGNSGFRELFAYISGANTGNSKLAMTTPVLQSGGAGGQKLAMTTPVLQTENAGGGMMAFVMPPGVKLEDLPRPASPAVTLRAVPGLKTAALRFSSHQRPELVAGNQAADARPNQSLRTPLFPRIVGR